MSGETTFQELPLSSVKTDRFQNIRTGKVNREALRAAMGWHGNNSVPIVRGPLEDGTYDLLAGFGRYGELKKNKAEKAMFAIRGPGDVSARAINLSENTVRGDLHWSEIATGVQEVSAEVKTATQTDLAKMCGISQGLVSECLRMAPALLSLAAELRRANTTILLTHDDALAVSKDIAKGTEYKSKALRELLVNGLAPTAAEGDEGGEEKAPRDPGGSGVEKDVAQSVVALNAMYAACFEAHKEAKKAGASAEDIARLDGMVDVMKWVCKARQSPPKGVAYEAPKRGRKAAD